MFQWVRKETSGVKWINNKIFQKHFQDLTQDDFLDDYFHLAQRILC